MFKNHLFILDLKIKKYKRIYIIPLSDLYGSKKINHQVFHRNPINYNYWNSMKSYAYLLGFLEK